MVYIGGPPMRRFKYGKSDRYQSNISSEIIFKNTGFKKATMQTCVITCFLWKNKHFLQRVTTLKKYICFSH